VTGRLVPALLVVIGAAVRLPGLWRAGISTDEEFTWFAVTDSLPITSMAGRRAARRILEACRYGEPALTLTPQAKAAAVVNTVAPNLTARLLELADRFLPGPAGEEGKEARPGWQSTSRWAPSVLTRLSDEAAVENNEMRRAAGAYGGSGKEVQ